MVVNNNVNIKLYQSSVVWRTQTINNKVYRIGDLLDVTPVVESIVLKISESMNFRVHEYHNYHEKRS
jgi:hypothetical protein